MTFRRALVGALTAMAIAGLTPAIANAGTASINGGTFAYTAGAAETHQVTVTGPGSADLFAADYTVVDTAERHTRHELLRGQRQHRPLHRRVGNGGFRDGQPPRPG